jgi:hypothetical protein
LVPKDRRWLDYISKKNVTAVAEGIEKPLHIKEPDSLVHGEEFANRYHFLKQMIQDENFGF